MLPQGFRHFCSRQLNAPLGLGSDRIVVAMCRFIATRKDGDHRVRHGDRSERRAIDSLGRLILDDLFRSTKPTSKNIHYGVMP